MLDPQMQSEQALLATDHQLRAEADEMLDVRGLRPLLEEYAPISVVGSYALQLMTWRDLDIVMNAPIITIAEFFELGRRVTTLLSAWKSFFTNNRDHSQIPRGLYWGIRLGDIKKGAWKIDLWAFDSDQYSAQTLHCEQLHSRLNAINRLAILRLKSRLWNDPRYRDTITSQQIYDAVLKHGVDSLDDFWVLYETK